MQDSIFEKRDSYAHLSSNAALQGELKRLNRELETRTQERDVIAKKAVSERTRAEILRAACQEFVDRVKRGEVRSVKSYQAFKDVLEATK
jgi:hypothetical protein